MSTSSLVRLRLELHDAPGALASVTAALAARSVDVVDVDVLEVDGSTVVDELLVRLPPGATSADAVGACRRAGAAVLSTQSPAPAVDRAVQAFDLVRAALDGADAGDLLARCAYADVGAVVPADVPFPLAERARHTGVPTSGRASLEAAPLGLDRGWVLWVAPQVSSPIWLVVVGRRLDVRFSATESARLRALASLLHDLPAAVGQASRSVG